MKKLQRVVECTEGNWHTPPDQGGRVYNVVLACGCKTWRPWKARPPHRLKCATHPVADG